MRNDAVKQSSPLKTLSVLVLPILLAHIIEALVPFINTLMAAHISQEALAAMALTGSVFFFFMGFCWGTLTSVGIVTAHRIGKQHTARLGMVLQSGFIVGIGLAIPVMVCLAFMKPILLHLGQEAVVVDQAQLFFYGVMWGIVADLTKWSIFQFAIAMEKPRVPLLANIFSLPLLVFLNDALIYGRYGLPELGIMGIGLGTALTYWIITIGLLWYFFTAKSFAQYTRHLWHWPRYKKAIKHLLHLGTPIGAMFNVEIAFFFAVALLMGTYGVDALAAHQIAVQWLSVTIVTSWAIGEAVTILTSKAYGAKNKPLVKCYIKLGVGISVGIMFIIAIFYLFFPRLIIGTDLDLADKANQDIINYAIIFLAFCALFQALDSVRIIIAAALRGLHDTHYPMWVAIISFWFVAFPAILIFNYWLKLGPNGLWYGCNIALLASVILQYFRLKERLA